MLDKPNIRVKLCKMDIIITSIVICSVYEFILKVNR